VVVLGVELVNCLQQNKRDTIYDTSWNFNLTLFIIIAGRWYGSAAVKATQSYSDFKKKKENTYSRD